MYRGQDMGSRERLLQTCLEIIQEGSPRKIYDVLPHISILRSPQLVDPLLKLLEQGEPSQKEVAALALGSLGDPRCIAALCQLFHHPQTLHGRGGRTLQTAIIVALGELGDEQAVAPLLEIFRLPDQEGPFCAQRRRLVTSSLGNLAQQGCKAAEQALIQVLSHDAGEIRAQAVTELSVSFWHRAVEAPDTLVHRIFRMTQEQDEEVRSAALSSLSNLAELGSVAAQRYLRLTAR